MLDEPKKPTNSQLEDWMEFPPKSLVVGHGAYTKALALVLNAADSRHDKLSEPPQAEIGGRLPRVLSELERVIIVPEAGLAAADLLLTWEAVWRWIVRLSAAGEDHEAVFLVLAPSHSREANERALATGLGLAVEELATHGQVIGEAGMPLGELIAVLQSARPCDHVRLLNRRNVDARRRALTELVMAAQACGDANAIITAAERVRDAFDGQQYDLDLFCQPPSHANGNRLRNMVKKLVTEPVTPEFAAECALHLPKLLS